MFTEKQVFLHVFGFFFILKEKSHFSCYVVVVSFQLSCSHLQTVFMFLYWCWEGERKSHMTYVLSQKLVASGKTAGLDLQHWIFYCCCCCCCPGAFCSNNKLKLSCDSCGVYFCAAIYYVPCVLLRESVAIQLLEPAEAALSKIQTD